MITGSSFRPEGFKLQIVEGRFCGASALTVLRGEAPACLFRSAISLEDCRIIARRFWTSPHLRRRGDGVPAFFLGSSHFGKTTENYLNDASASISQIQQLFKEITDPSAIVRRALATILAGYGAKLRPAECSGRTAPTVRAMSWSGTGLYQLEPHDDLGQLCHPAQQGFEIQNVKVRTVCAVNLYISVPLNQGPLKIWNIIPDDEARRSRGIEHTGYSYRDSDLAPFASLNVSLAAGDVCIINGGLVHAVVGQTHAPSNVPSEARLLLSFFLGFVDDANVVCWT